MEQYLFHIYLQSDSAVIGEDVESASGIVSWADGDSAEKSITVNIIDDNESEANEDFVITLTSVDDSNLGVITQHTVTISDDDSNTAPTITLPENSEVNTGATVTMTATASDNENDAMTYLWQQTAGTSVNLTNTDTLAATFVAPSSAGDYRVNIYRH